MDNFSISFSHPLSVDMGLFAMWVNGLTEQEASKRFASTMPASVADIPFNLLQLEVSEQYNLFKYLETYLQTPVLLNSPILSSMSTGQKENLLENYYSFNKEVMREILGKKMSAKLRKDMEDVSEKTDVSLHSCRRQFDNVKNILKTLEDVEDTIYDILKNHFMFTDNLVKRYCPVVFVFLERFETTKKKMNYLTFDDLMTCSEYIYEKWTYHYDDNSTLDKAIDRDEIDRHFVQDLRDIRNTVTERDFLDMQKTFVMLRLEKKATTLHFKKTLETNFRSITRSIFLLGGNLTHSKDVRDFFIDCIEKIVEPIKQLDWAHKELEFYISMIVDSWGDFKEDYRHFVRKFDVVFLRFMDVMKRCLLEMYK